MPKKKVTQFEKLYGKVEEEKKGGFRRPGKISQKELEYIKYVCEEKSAGEIADELGRNPDTISEIIRKLRPETTIPVQNEQLRKRETVRRELRESAIYQLLQEEFEPEEIKYFEDSYIRLYEQFSENVVATEQVQIFKAIKFEILMHRNLKQQKRINQDIEELERQLAAKRRELEQEGGKDAEERIRLEDESVILEKKVAVAYAQKQSRANELNRLDERHQKLQEALKGTREQRIAKIEASRKSFTDLIKLLMEQDIAAKEDAQLNQVRRALEREVERLATPIEYADRVVDQPLLTPDTVELDFEVVEKNGKRVWRAGGPTSREGGSGGGGSEASED